jgi:hypothetical protein
MEVLDLGGAILGIHSLVVHLKNVNFEQILLLRLPFHQSTFDLLDNKQAQAYFFRRSVTGCADCGSFWSRR